MEIIAYGIVAKPPTCVLKDNESGGRVWSLSMVVDCDCDPELAKPGYYQVIVDKSDLDDLGDTLKVGTPILVRGRVSETGPSSLDSQWNHRVVRVDSIDVIFGALNSGRSFRLSAGLEVVAE